MIQFKYRKERKNPTDFTFTERMQISKRKLEKDTEARISVLIKEEQKLK